MSRYLLVSRTLVALAAVAPIPANAQTPQRTTATYEDWTLRCETQGTPAVRSCEIVQAVNMQGQPNPITQIAVGRAAKGDPLKAVFQVPINVWLPSGVKLVYDEKEPGFAATFKRCVPSACLSDIELKDDMIKKLRARAENGRLEFKDAAQRDVAIPVSFKGFGQALDAMPKE